jgi:hypothetical protein
MSPNLYIMPLLALLAGVASLFLDPRDPQKKRLIYLLLPVMLLTCTLQIYFGYVDETKARIARQQITNRLNEITVSLTELLITFGWSAQGIADLTSQTSADKPGIDKLAMAQQSLNAEDELRKTVLPKSDRQGAVTIEYFPKDVDREKVETALKDLGFRLATGTPQFTKVPTNSLWFGSQVPPDDVKRVAYVLIRAGVQLKAIRRFRASVPREDALLIQVGGDPQVVDSPPITVEQIRSAADFPYA